MAVEMPWPDLERALHARNPRNVNELNHICRDANLIDSCGKCLVGVIAAGGGSIGY